MTPDTIPPSEDGPNIIGETIRRRVRKYPKPCPRCGGSGVFRAKRVKAKCELCAGSGQYVPESVE